MTSPPQLFLSYSPADESWKDRLWRHLRVLEKAAHLTLWDVGQIPPGSDRMGEIEKALAEADVAVLLVTTDFLISDLVRETVLPRLRERQTSDGVRVIPLLVKPCLLDDEDWLSSLEHRPRGERTLAERDEIRIEKDLTELTREIRNLLTGKPPPPDDVLAAWLNQVAEDHRRLADHFERPVELQDIERAWVRLDLALPEAGHRDVLGERTLDDFLALDPEEHPWITRRWLVEGDPGSGKTTLLRHLAGRLARADEPWRVPIFVSLPRVVNVKTPLPLPDYLDEEYGGFCGAELSGVLGREGREGRLLVLLDGLDEVPPERRERVERLLARIEEDWPKSSIVLTSRPLGMGRVPHGFRKLLLQPLDDVQRGRFLKKWFGHREASDPAADAALAARHFDTERSLRELSHNPLHLTLLTVLWEKGVKAPTRRSELYDEIFALLLEGRHKNPPVPIKATEDVRQALRHLAFGLTRDDLPGETPGQLEQRLRERGLTELRERLETAWPETLGAFFTDVAERTYILGPHDGPRAAWRFWHRTFREALAAEKLKELLDEDDSLLEQVKVRTGPRLLTSLRNWWGGNRAAGLSLAFQEGDEGRWAEPFSLLAGHLADPDGLVLSLIKANRPLGLRALATAQGLKPETFHKILGLTASCWERQTVFEGIVDLVGDPETCLALVDRLRNDTRDGNDLFFLYRAAEDVAKRWPDLDGHVRQLQTRFFDHIPAPEDPELFRTVETPLDRRVKLWREIPAGEGWIGDGDSRHRVAIRRPFDLGAVPVTNAQYAAFDPDKPEHGSKHHPRVDVTWVEAVSFCRWLAARVPGCAGARLPSEEEWEYACRAGSATEYWSGDGETALAEAGWYHTNSGNDIHRVGEKPANPWGLYDVHGNVWEWTADVRDAGKYRNRPRDRPFPIDPSVLPADLAASSRGVDRVMRGGSLWISADDARSAYRNIVPGFEIGNRGFRVLLPSAPRS